MFTVGRRKKFSLYVTGRRIGGGGGGWGCSFVTECASGSCRMPVDALDGGSSYISRP